ncbi:MAG: thiamine-phosphate kinase [Thermoleophilia bacterium]
MRLADLGELGLLRELEQRGLAGPIGDDVALLPPDIVVTQDTMVEDIHFRLAWTSWHDLGYKAAAVNLSDLAAAGCEPLALFVSLTAPPEARAEAVLELYEGLNEPGVPVRGGDTTSGHLLALTVTAIGRSSRVPGRGGALPGDVVVVTGPLGGSAAGLHALEAGLAGCDDLIELHHRPPLRLDEGRRLAAVAHALLDLSDGLATDAGHMARRSGCAIELDVEAIPLASGLARAGDAHFWTLGEDYELLAALAPDDAAALGFPAIGRCVPGEGVVIRLGGSPIEARGWEHFRS